MSATSKAVVRTGTDAKLIVGVGDLLVSKDANATLVTYALGSCIGVTIYDPVAKVGGLLHFMLPQASINKQKAELQPAMFGDAGLPLLFRSCYELGAKKERLIVCGAGGSELMGDGHFKIGARNRTILRAVLWKNGVLITKEDTGGSHSRTLFLHMSDGRVDVRSPEAESVLWKA
jgi:chemotaxis protein CheD